MNYVSSGSSNRMHWGNFRTTGNYHGCNSGIHER